MTVGRSSTITDPADLHFRIATVRTGCLLTFATVIAGLIYFAATWDRGFRPVLTGVTGAVLAGALIIYLVLPVPRIVAGRWREIFFMAWSAASVLAILALVALDPLQPTPLALGLFMPLLFAGMSYPRWVATAIAFLVPVGYLAVVLATGGEDPSYSAFFVFSLSGAAGMCLWQTSNRERQRAELERHRDELARISRIDPLTEALNRRGFEERFSAELADAGRSSGALTLVVIDLDHFKQVNDTQGHAAGDRMLCHVVSTLKKTLRPMDAVGRLGGDEFAVVLPGVDAPNAAAVATRLRAELMAVSPVSVGHGSYPSEGEGEEALYRRADEVLYAAKQARHGRAAGAASVTSLTAKRSAS